MERVVPPFRYFSGSILDRGVWLTLTRTQTPVDRVRRWVFFDEPPQGDLSGQGIVDLYVWNVNN